ncbi:MAG TPA: hypothetical protein VGH98_12900 [Gemmatimonadaceae bacterium]|jgi:hypothetical protein
MSVWLPPAHLALCLVIIVWDIVLAGRIARVPQAPRAFAALTGLAGLLVLPALIVALATTTAVTGRAIFYVDWIWPALLAVFAAQAVYALARRVVNPAWGIPIAIYDVIIAAAGIVRYLASRGVEPSYPFLLLLASHTAALSLATTSAAISNPLYLNVPMIAPAFPALRPVTASFRALLSAVALGWSIGIAFQLPVAIKAVRSYRAHATDRLTERPEGDFSIGVKLFPDIGSPPPPPAVESDLALADTLTADVVAVTVVPDVTNQVLDSLAHALDQLQRDSTLLIVTLGYRGKLLPELRHVPLDPRTRIAAIRRIVRRLRPDILLPAEDPYGVGERLLGRLQLPVWEDYLTTAAAAAKSVDRRIRIGLSASAFDSRDSALYAWAAGPASPIDILGFSLFPDRRGAEAIDAYTRTADRWMAVVPPSKPHWIFAAGGYPLAHGEASQTQAIWDALAWATAHPAIKGLVVYEAGDYGQARGLRSPSGRLREATLYVMGAMRALREATVTTPTP